MGSTTEVGAGESLAATEGALRVPLSDVVAPTFDIPCERNLLHPCTEASPNQADYMVRYVPCDCEVDPEETVVAFCAGCLGWLLRQPYLRCGCGIVYQPPTRMFQDVVEIPR